MLTAVIQLGPELGKHRKFWAFVKDKAKHDFEADVRDDDANPGLRRGRILTNHEEDARGLFGE